jgi:NADPH2:quinone reductase
MHADMDAKDVKHRLLDANGGAPVDVVLEMVGGHVFDGSLEALAPFGRLVTYGMAGRVPPSPLTPARLMVGSHSIIGFWLVDCMRPGNVHTMVAEPLRELVAAVSSGALRPAVGPVYPLSHAHRAHEDLRGRRTTGKVVLDPRLDGPHV